MADYLPISPASDRSVAVWTYADAVDHLLDWRDIDRSDGINLRQVRRAVETAYRELTQGYRWNYYDRYATIRTVATQTTGSIEYDHTGGSSERLVTLTGATFPTDARFYRIIIADAHYDIDTYVSSTTVTLKQANNPGADVASGTSYTLYRRSYPLPPQFRTLYSIHEIDGHRPIHVVNSDAQQISHIGLPNPSTPFRCTVRNEGEYYGHYSIVFDPPPNEADLYEVFYRAAPRPLTTDTESTGTVTTNGSATTVTGTGTAFAAKHVGDIIRLSSSTTVVPTGFAGSPPTDSLGGDGTYSPYSEQRVIQTFSSTTSIAVDTAFSAFTGVKFIISSPLDIRGDAMLTAFLRACEAELAEIRNLDNAEAARARADRAKIVAIENDFVLDAPPMKSVYDPFSYTTSTDDE